jgi:hypothetical protein
MMRSRDRDVLSNSRQKILLLVRNKVQILKIEFKISLQKAPKSHQIKAMAPI